MGVGEATQSALKDTRVLASRPWHMYLKARGRKDRSMMNNVMKRTHVNYVLKRVSRFAVGPSRAGFPTDLLPRKQMGWQCRRSSSREESNHLSFQRFLRRVAIACWSCTLEQADGPKSF